MKKYITILAVALFAMFATAQTNQYFWYNGNLMMGNPIAQIDSVTFGEGEPTDTLHILLPRTIIKEVHDTVEVAVHDTLYITNYTCLPEGALPGEFSVGPTKKVRFSKGNLQYQASTNTWRFAENQWDYVGDASLGNVYENGVKCDNSLISTTYSGWIDLFGYSTSKNYYGISSSTNDNDYAGTFVDWGNAVGDNWRTLTKIEWEYLLNSSPNRVVWATINGVKGAVILSDDFINNPANYSNFSGSEPYELTGEQWKNIEKIGAIFLPAGGYREGIKPRSIQVTGDYFANTNTSQNSIELVDGLQFAFIRDPVHPDSSNHRFNGRTVRLAQDAE